MRKDWSMSWAAVCSLVAMVALWGCGNALPPAPELPDDEGAAGEPVPDPTLSGTIRGDLFSMRFEDSGNGQAIVLSKGELLRFASELGMYDLSPAAAKAMPRQQSLDNIVSLQLGKEVSLGTGGLSVVLESLTFDFSSLTITATIRINMRNDDGVLLDSGVLEIVLSGVQLNGDGGISVGSVIVRGVDSEGNPVFEEDQGGGNFTPPEANTPPIAVANAIPTTATIGTAVLLTAVGSADADGDDLTFAWAQTAGAPTVALTGAGSETAGFVAPDIPPATALTFTVTVGDGTAQSTASVDVTIQQPNRPPNADAGEDQTAQPGDEVVLDGSGSSDPDDDSLTFTWRQSGGAPAVSLSGTDTPTATFTVPGTITENVDLEFELTVNDGNLSALDTVRISVEVVTGGGGGGGGGPVTPPDELLDLVPGDVTFVVALRSFSDFSQGFDSLVGIADAFTNLLAPIGWEGLSNVDASIAFLFRANDNLSACVEEVTLQDLIDALEFAFPGMVEVFDVGDGVTRVDIPSPVVPIGPIFDEPNQVSHAPGTLQVFVKPTGQERFIVIAGSKDAVLAITSHQGTSLDDVFDASWLSSFEAGDLVLYTDGTLPTPPLPWWLSTPPWWLVPPVMPTASPLSNVEALASAGNGDTNATCMVIEIGDPLGITSWERFNPGSQSATKLANMPTTTDSMLVGLPDEPIVFAVGGSPVPVDMFAQILNSVDPGVLDALVASSSMSLSELPGGYSGLFGLANVVTVTHPNPTVNAAEIYRTLVAGLMNDLQDLLDAELVVGVLVYEEQVAEPGVQGGRLVDRLTIGVDLLLQLLGLPEDDYTDEIMAVLGSEPLLIRIVKVNQTHVAISMGGGVDRLNQIITLVESGMAPLASRVLVADVASSLPAERALEAYVALGQLPKLVYDIAQALGANLPLDQDPGNANEAIGVTRGRDGNSERSDVVAPAELLRGLAEFLGSVFPAPLPPIDIVCDIPDNEEAIRSSVFDLINQERTSRALDALTPNTTLNVMAEDYCCEMIEGGFFSHNNPYTGEGPGQRAINAGYIYLAVGENLAASQDTPEQVVADWMASTEGHRENILATQWREFGLGIRRGGQYGVYWVLEFGRPPD